MLKTIKKIIHEIKWYIETVIGLFIIAWCEPEEY
jgi:hypothetical protein